jgi:hypothetical protein
LRDEDAGTGGTAMPTRLPDRKSRTEAVERDESSAWLMTWALSICFSAVFLAAIVYFDGRDNSSAGMILLAACGIMAYVLHADASRRRGR